MSRDGSQPLRRRQTTRRRLIGATLAGGAGLAGATLLGCSTGAKSSRQARGSSAGGSQTAGATPKPGGTYNAYYTTDTGLDPRNSGGFTQYVVGGAYSRLFRFQTTTDPKFNINHVLENDLATSAESPDGVTWTVKLRPDAAFHNIPPVNGHAVEAEDVKTSWDRYLDPAGHFQYLGQLDMVDPAQITTPDAHTIVFKLRYPYGPFLRILAEPEDILILPRESATGAYDPAKLVIGSGPFMVANHEPDVEFDYTRNPSWFDKGRPYVDELRMAIIPDANAQIAQFTAGHLDELRPDVTNVAAVQRNNPQAVHIKQDAGTPLAIRMQLGEPSSAFRDLRVRQAFSLALDHDALNQTMFQGEGVLSISLATSLGQWALTASDMPAETQKFLKFDLAQAKQLISAAGVQNTRFKFAYVASGALASPQLLKLVDTVHGMLTQLGVPIDMVPIDYTKDWQAGGHGYRQGFSPPNTLFVDTQSGQLEADAILYGYFDSKSNANPAHLSDPDLDALIAKERATLKDEDRMKVVWDIQKYIAAKLYVIPTGGAAYTHFFIQPRVQNFCPTVSFGTETELYPKVWLNA